MQNTNPQKLKKVLMEYKGYKICRGIERKHDENGKFLGTFFTQGLYVKKPNGKNSWMMEGFTGMPALEQAKRYINRQIEKPKRLELKTKKQLLLNKKAELTMQVKKLDKQIRNLSPRKKNNQTITTSKSIKVFT